MSEGPSTSEHYCICSRWGLVAGTSKPSSWPCHAPAGVLRGYQVVAWHQALPFPPPVPPLLLRASNRPTGGTIFWVVIWALSASSAVTPSGTSSGRLFWWTTPELPRSNTAVSTITGLVTSFTLTLCRGNQPIS